MSELESKDKISHYYGDIVRLLFMLSGGVMLIGLPLFLNYIQIPSILAVVGILLITITAGLTNPKQKWDAGLNVLVASVGFMIFGSFAVNFYQNYGIGNKLFVGNLFLSAIFLTAVYFAVKTLRGKYLA